VTGEGWAHLAVNLRALERRLSSTWRTRTVSPRTRTGTSGSTWEQQLRHHRKDTRQGHCACYTVCTAVELAIVERLLQGYVL